MERKKLIDKIVLLINLLDERSLRLIYYFVLGLKNKSAKPNK